MRIHRVKTPRRCSDRLSHNPLPAQYGEEVLPMCPAQGVTYVSGRSPDRVGRLVDLTHLHIGVYSQIGVPNGRTGRRRLVARRHFELRAEAFD